MFKKARVLFSICYAKRVAILTILCEDSFMHIKRVSLSWVAVADYSRSKKFFVDTLGLKVFEEQVEYSWLELKGEQGGAALGVCKESPQEGSRAGMNAVVTFVVDDYEGSKKELSAKGVALFGEVAGYPGVPRMACFKDPDGNLFQLVEETAGETDKI